MLVLLHFSMGLAPESTSHSPDQRKSYFLSNSP